MTLLNMNKITTFIKSAILIIVFLFAWNYFYSSKDTTFRKMCSGDETTVENYGKPNEKITRNHRELYFDVVTQFSLFHKPEVTIKSNDDYWLPDYSDDRVSSFVDVTNYDNKTSIYTGKKLYKDINKSLNIQYDQIDKILKYKTESRNKEDMTVSYSNFEGRCVNWEKD